MSFRVLFVIMIFSISTPAFAQFGGGGFGSGIGPDDFGSHIASKDVYVAISKSGRSVTAFSSLTGKTSKLNFDNQIKSYLPMVTTGLACFMHEKIAYAFSAQTGKWDSVKTKNGTWLPTSVGSYMIIFVDGKTAYAVGEKHGKWIQVEADGVPAPVISIFTPTIHFQVGSKIYICSDASTEWQVIDLEEDGDAKKQ